MNGTRRGRAAWAVLPLLPALLGGCALAGGDRAAPGSTAATPAPAGTSWTRVSTGRATPAPVPTRYPGRATTGPEFLPLPAPASAAPAGAGTASCADVQDFSTIRGLDVRPGSTSARVSWFNPGGRNLVRFRVTAIAQDLAVGTQRDVGWTEVAPPPGCGTVAATVGGLDRRTRYVFSVDAVVTRRSGDGTHAATVARSHPVATG